MCNSTFFKRVDHSEYKINHCQVENKRWWMGNMMARTIIAFDNLIHSFRGLHRLYGVYLNVLATSLFHTEKQLPEICYHLFSSLLRGIVKSKCSLNWFTPRRTANQMPRHINHKHQVPYVIGSNFQLDVPMETLCDMLCYKPSRNNSCYLYYL